MTFLFDQNISHRILKLLPETYQSSSTVKQEGLLNSTDKEVWDFAKKNNFIIVTQDSDFNDLNSLFGFPPKIIWIRTGNIKTSQLAKILIDYASEIDSFIANSKYGCFEIFSLKV